MRIAKVVVVLTIAAAACGAINELGGGGGGGVGGRPARPELVLRTSRPVVMPGAPVVLTAELVGGVEVEGLYCPTVVWEWPDGTESKEGGDCPAWEAGEGMDYQRRWTRVVALGTPGKYVIGVRLEKTGRVEARTAVVVVAAGGE